MFASCLAVSGLAVTVAKTVDDFMFRWENAEDSAFSLLANVKTFCASLTMLSQWMQTEFINSGASSDWNFVKDLAFSTEGCLRFLMALKVELNDIGYKPQTGRFTTKPKLKVLWAESRIRILRDHLSFQTEGLMLLLKWYVRMILLVLYSTEIPSLMSNSTII